MNSNLENPMKKLPDTFQSFFHEMSFYLQTPLYFYGSFMRKSDYFPGSSDIDIDIFTDNTASMMSILAHFLNVRKNKFKRIVWRLNHNNKIVYGFKIMYRNEEMGLVCEISIYNEKFKEDVLYEHNLKLNLPVYASWMLILLKWIHYTLGWMSRETFIYWKRKIMSLGIGLPDDQFIAYRP